jgi:MSHA biogenesis protein MshL
MQANLNCRIGTLLAGVLTAMLLAGCTSNPYRWDHNTAKKIESEVAQAGKQSSAVPPEVSQALLPPIQIQMPEGGMAPLEARFDLSLSNAPARNVFMGLVEGTPYSMVVHPDVSGSMSLHLKGITVPEAMDAIRRVYGYDYKREGNRFYILGRGMQTRFFPVNYLNMNRKGKSDIRVTSGELTQTTSSGSGSTGSSGSSQTSTRSPSIQVETDSQADYWKEIKEAITTIIGTSGGRQVVVNPQSGLVIVRAMPDELRVVEDYLGASSTTANRQVVLEAKILNVKLSDSFQAGINWSALQGSSVIGQVGGGTIFNGSWVSEIAGNTGNLAGVLPSGTNTSAFGGVFTVATAATDFSAFVEMLKTQGDVHVLSSPRVSTVNNQKAVIKVGGDEFFITGITSTESSVSGGQPTTEVELTPFFSGIALDVTPQIDKDGNIILHIHPAVSEVGQRNKTFKVNDKTSDLPLAVSTIQESDNVVRAQSGQFIVIGGLMKEGTTDDNAGIPLLGDIPIIGNLFKHKRVTRIKNELVILLKPTIVDIGDTQTWGNLIQESEARMKKISH